MFGAKLPDATGVLLGIFGDVGEFLGGDDVADILHEVSKDPFPAAYAGFSNSIGYVPSARGVEIGLSVNEQILVRFEVDSGLGVGRC